jgi:hypothetical protein
VLSVGNEGAKLGVRVGRGKSLWLKDYSIFPIFFQLAIREWFCRCCEWRMTDRPARKFSKLPGKLGLYSEEARQTTSRIPRNACTIGIRCDWRLLILRCHHGESVGNYVALERHVSRSHLESEPDSLQATRAAGTYCRILFPLLGAALTLAGIGWFRRRLWGWRLAVAIIATQVAGDFLNCVRGEWLRGGTGVVITGALLLYLLRPIVKNTFA